MQKCHLVLAADSYAHICHLITGASSDDWHVWNSFHKSYTTDRIFLKPCIISNIVHRFSEESSTDEMSSEALAAFVNWCNRVLLKLLDLIWYRSFRTNSNNYSAYGWLLSMFICLSSNKTFISANRNPLSQIQMVHWKIAVKQLKICLIDCSWRMAQLTDSNKHRPEFVGSPLTPTPESAHKYNCFLKPLSLFYALLRSKCRFANRELLPIIACQQVYQNDTSVSKHISCIHTTLFLKI